MKIGLTGRMAALWAFSHLITFTCLAQAPTVSFDPITATTIAKYISLLTVDKAGNIYGIDTLHRVVRINTNGTISFIAGNGIAGYTDGPGAGAQFRRIRSGTVDAAGNIFVTDSNAIRKISTGGLVSTVAGSAVAGYQDGPGAQALLNQPLGIAVDPAGNLYVAESNNAAIRKINAAGTVTTFAGNGVPATGVYDPQQLALDGAGNLYVTQIYGNFLKISPAGEIASFAAGGTAGFKSGIAVDNANNVYFISGIPPISEVIYKVSPTGIVSPLAGSNYGSKDGIGTEAQFADNFLASDGFSTLYTGNIPPITDVAPIPPGTPYIVAFRKLSKPIPQVETNEGAASVAAYFSVSGTYLTAAAMLVAPNGFEISTEETGVYSNSLSVAPDAGEINVRKIFIRLKAGLVPGTYNDSVVLSAPGAATQKLGVSGIVKTSPKKLVIIGSGTSACIGPNPVSSCYVNQLNTYYNKLAPFDTIIDNHLARGSTNCYNGMPSSYISPYNAASGYTPIKDINITAALALHPDAVLVNYPSNGYDMLSVSEIMFCLRTIRDSANKNGVPCYITTTQPRTSPASFNTSAIKRKLAMLKDSILAAFGNYAIDFYTGLIKPADSSLLYDAGDQVNMNAEGHTILFQRVLGKDPLADVPAPGTGTGLKANYYNGIPSRYNSILTRVDPQINNDFVYVSPAPGIVNVENYFVRWTGKVQPRYSETYTFYTNSDDGISVWVNGVKLIYNWTNHSSTENSGSITLVAGKQYDILVEYYQATGFAVSKLSWSSAHTPKQIIPAAQLYPGDQELKTPACTTNVLPVNGAVLTTTNSVTLNWETVPYADYYEVHILKNGAPVPALISYGANIPGGLPDSVLAGIPRNGNIAEVSGLDPSTTYNWYVIARNAVFSAMGCDTSNTTSFTTAPVRAGDGTGLRGAYYNGTSLAGAPLLTRTDTTINFELTYSGIPQRLSPAPGVVPEDKYSVRWSGWVQPLYTGKYTFYTVADDGVRLWVEGISVVDNWVNQSATETTGSSAYAFLDGQNQTLLAGQRYRIVMEYYENTGDAVAKLYWSGPGTPKAIIPKSQLYPATDEVVPISSCPLKTSPGEGIITTQTTATLVWLPVPYATSYDVYVTGFINGSMMTFDAPVANTTTTAYIISGLEPGTTYGWAVVPKNETGFFDYCKLQSQFILKGAGTGLLGKYYNGTALNGTPLLTRIDTTINFELTYTHLPLSPAPGVVPEDQYSVRWTGQVQPLYSDNYYFYTLADDGIRLWINGSLIIDNWTNQDATEKKSNAIPLDAGKKYDIMIEYYENTGAAVAMLYWSAHNTPKQIVPRSQLYPPANNTKQAGNNAHLQPVVAVPPSASASDFITASVSPSPVKPGALANLRISSGKPANAVMRIIGINGNIISTQQLSLVAGVNTKTINTASLAQGLYIISIGGADKPVNLKLLVE